MNSKDIQWATFYLVQQLASIQVKQLMKTDEEAGNELLKAMFVATGMAAGKDAIVEQMRADLDEKGNDMLDLIERGFTADQAEEVVEKGGIN